LFINPSFLYMLNHGLAPKPSSIIEVSGFLSLPKQQDTRGPKALKYTPKAILRS
jgi:hypothetical protein